MFEYFYDLSFLCLLIAIVTIVVSSKAVAKCIIFLRNPEVIISALDARLIYSHSDNTLESLAVSIVEESAIAASLPVPRICVLDKDFSINSFVVGSNANNAIIGVTEGFLECLTYKEMQAIIAYQLCKIQSGEIKNELVILAITSAFNSISVTGKIIYSSIDIHESYLISFIGAVIFIFGLPGVVFSTFLKFVTSRQGVFLEDQAAVQFIDDKDALRSALKKIGAVNENLQLGILNELSHLFFVGSAFSSAHISIKNRIYAIDPQWNGVYPEVKRLKFTNCNVSEEQDSRIITVMEHEQNNPKINLCRGILAEIPKAILKQLRNPYQVRAMLIVLLLDKSPELEKRQMELVFDNGDMQLYQDVISARALKSYIKKEQYVPIIRIANSTLAGLPKKVFKDFKTLLYKLISDDKKVTLFEYCMYEILLPSTSPRLSTMTYNEGAEILKRCLREESFIYSIVDRAVKAVANAESKTKKALVAELLELASKDGVISAFEEQYISAISSAIGVDLLSN